ncbi:MAG: exodeoxyribonuclease VII large subunit [Candidatus Saccharimonadales bacterium]
MEFAVLGVSDFVEAVNQTLAFSYTHVAVEGELSNFRISKNKWVYFDLKDESATLKCFTTVYALPGPLEDGMIVRVTGNPRLHPLYNFSFQVQSIVPVGEGALRKAADLLAAKLEAEGLFDPTRKRSLPVAPRHIALVTAGDSAAYADFVKIITARWGGVQIDHYNVLVQGEHAPGEIVAALHAAAETDAPAEVVVLIRGGGSAEDLAAWNDERVVRAVAASRVPTLVAIGHEVDVSLAELAADRRASTPSNAAELIVPDRHEEMRHLEVRVRQLSEQLRQVIAARRAHSMLWAERLDGALSDQYARARQYVQNSIRLFAAYDPARPLHQGYALVRSHEGVVISRAKNLEQDDMIEVQFTDGSVVSQVKTLKRHKEREDE